MKAIWRCRFFYESKNKRKVNIKVLASKVPMNAAKRMLILSSLSNFGASILDM